MDVHVDVHVDDVHVVFSGIVQDTLLGVSKFTRRDTLMNFEEVCNAFMHVESWDGNVREREGECC